MRNYKFKKQGIEPFFKKHGFTLAMGIGVLGLGLAVWSAVDSVRSIKQEPTDTGRPVEQIEQNIPDPRTPAPTVMPSATPAPTPTPTPTATPVPTPTPEVSAAYPAYFLFPVNGTVTNDFSDSLPVFSATMGDWRAHNGVDIEAAADTPVNAVADGIVTDVTKTDAWGTVVEVDHGGGLTARYCNLSETTAVAKGDTVTAGKQLGTVGESGYEECGEAPHLHLEMTFAGKNVDPITVMNEKTT